MTCPKSLPTLMFMNLLPYDSMAYGGPWAAGTLQEGEKESYPGEGCPGQTLGGGSWDSEGLVGRHTLRGWMALAPEIQLIVKINGLAEAGA